MSVKHRGAAPLRCGAARILKGRHAGRLGYYDDDEGDRAVVYLGEPIRSGYVLIQRDHLVNVTSERGTRAHPDFYQEMGIT